MHDPRIEEKCGATGGGDIKTPRGEKQDFFPTPQGKLEEYVSV